MKKLETIKKEEVDNIDLDIYSLMKKLPNNELYHSLYLRMDKNSNTAFVRILCSSDELTNFFGFLISDEFKENGSIATDVSIAILNVSLNIFKNMSKLEQSEFLKIVKKLSN